MATAGCDPRSLRSVIDHQRDSEDVYMTNSVLAEKATMELPTFPVGWPAHRTTLAKARAADTPSGRSPRSSSLLSQTPCPHFHPADSRPSVLFTRRGGRFVYPDIQTTPAPAVAQ